LPINRTFSEVNSDFLQNRTESEFSHPDEVTQLKKKNEALRKKLDQLTLALDI